MRNLITDVAGIAVGQAHSPAAASGVTAIVFDEAVTVGFSILGGAPGTRDTALLDPAMTVERADAIVLSGGSAFGLDAAGGVQAVLEERGRGFRVGQVRVPIVPQAICFDLLNGGDKGWGRKPPYFGLGIAAAEAAGAEFALGTAGAGHGAMTARLKGGLGSASMRTASGFMVGAIVAVNPVGCVTIGQGPHFWAAPYERDGEYGGLGWPATMPEDALAAVMKGGPGQSTTIAVVATDARLTKAEATRVAAAAHAGMARAIRPSHTPLDGDCVFAAATGRHADVPDVFGRAEIALAAADCLARAIARGVYEAQALPFAGALPSWQDRFGRQ